MSLHGCSIGLGSSIAVLSAEQQRSAQSVRVYCPNNTSSADKVCRPVSLCRHRGCRSVIGRFEDFDDDFLRPFVQIIEHKGRKIGLVDDSAGALVDDSDNFGACSGPSGIGMGIFPEAQMGESDLQCTFAAALTFEIVLYMVDFGDHGMRLRRGLCRIRIRGTLLHTKEERVERWTADVHFLLAGIVRRSSACLVQLRQGLRWCR